jgi:hypothetical protein
MMDAPTNSVVKFNVGGKIFATTNETLENWPDCLLTVMHRQNLMAPALLVDGGYFLDRDPKLFEHMMHFLRHNFGPADLYVREMKLLRQEADFLLLPELKELMQTTELVREAKILLLKIRPPNSNASL